MQDQISITTIKENQVEQDLMHDDRRCFPRMSRLFVTTITELGGSVSRKCDVRDISESGLFARVPTDYDVCVGKRCEVTITEENNAEHPSNLIVESLYATIVRTERIELETETVVGIGLRFDQPLYF